MNGGAGDGNQLKLAQYPRYIGFDVSKTAVSICRKIFKKDKTKSFYCNGLKKPLDVNGILQKEFGRGGADIALSLDVLYHLVEDDVFSNYMATLFSSSDKYICIYSCDFDEDHAQHVKCRCFTKYVSEHFPQWKLIKKIPNKFPYKGHDTKNTSFADFYFYKKGGA